MPKIPYIIVDVETSGPNPGTYALLSLGACTLIQPRNTFYVELQPDKDGISDEAMQIHKLSVEALAVQGTPPSTAMQQFADWLNKLELEETPIFTAFNAPFDWMFVSDYFHRYLGYNPFGHKALDMKALYMGLYKTTWEDTSHDKIAAFFNQQMKLTHHALEDAEQEANLFLSMLKELQGDRHDHFE